MSFAVPAQAALVALLVACSAPVWSATAPFEPGEWEISTKMEGIPGMPANMPAHSFRQCLTPQNNLPQENGKMDPRCKILENSMNGNTVHWKMQCDMPEGKTVSDGDVTYRGNSFDGISHIKTSYGGQTMNMTSRMSGKRLGNCAASKK